MFEFVSEPLLFLMTALVVIVTPGPDMAVVAAHAVRGGRRAGIAAALGIMTGCLVHIGLGAVGLSAILATSAIAFTILKLAGAAYLVYLGVRMLLTRGDAAPVEAARHGTAQRRGAFLQGFLSNVLNPKVALFFLAFLPQVIAEAAPSKAAAFVLLGVVFNLIATVWLFAFAWAADRVGAAVRPGTVIRLWIDRVFGGMLVLLGLRLASVQRSAT